MSEENKVQNIIEAKAKFYTRRRKLKNWTGVILGCGEFGFVTDSTDNDKRLKIGDGVNDFEKLPWITAGERNFDPESELAQSGIAVAEAINPLDEVLLNILTAIQSGNTNAEIVGAIEQIIVSYLEAKTIAEVEE